MAEDARLICASAALVDGGPGVRFSVSRHGRENPAFVIRYRGKIYAYLNRCGHVPIELDWQHGQFFDDSKLYLICATHGALYAPETGQCLLGRCGGNGLQRLTVEERDNSVYFIPSE